MTTTWTPPPPVIFKYDEKNKPEQYAAYTVQQLHDAHAAGCAEVAEMEARKDAAYLERNQVVAALAKCFPSGTARTAIEGWSEDWHGCVYIDLPTGQASWHHHDLHTHLFAGLGAYTKPWDGHTTPEKYERLAALTRLDCGPITPAAWWREAGQPDPHAAARYRVERAALLMGDLTDDELANAVFLHGNRKPTMEDLAAGVLPAITYLDAAKDRIRWLSRALERALAETGGATR